ncbi:tetratricopeptide repeat protein [Proteobacteria bacterium 005FR1]|nr:tetratricopeptide repeat protein [Proteobacteria bacterium 005FR1]
MKTVEVCHRRRLGIFGVCVLLLSGCASTPSSQSAGDEFGMFYDGNSDTAYATAFPVASAEEAYRNGDAALRSGDQDRALFEYIRGLRLQEKPELSVLYKIGSIHHGRGNHRLAALAYRWVLEEQELHVEAGTGMGMILLEQRQYDAAREHLQLVVSSGRAPWRAHNGLGIIADMHSEFEAAEEHYRNALQASPNSSTIFNNLGYSRYLAGDWDGAAAALQNALRINGNYERAWRNLGLVYARQKKYDRALEALERTSDAAEAHNDVGFVAMLEGDYVRALSFFEKAMRLSPAFYVVASENAENVRRMLNRNN